MMMWTVRVAECSRRTCGTVLITIPLPCKEVLVTKQRRKLSVCWYVLFILHLTLTQDSYFVIGPDVSGPQRSGLLHKTIGKFRT
jgi:hypothetical protein